MFRKLLRVMRDADRASRHRRELRELAAMEPRILRDIGVTDHDIASAMRRLRSWI
jgi:uncharacterized protein YjiS (DUF1127 family)